MAKAGYVIQVGHESPQEVIVSIPNKDGNPGVNQTKVFNEVGLHMIINRCRVWCRRVMNDGKLPKDDAGNEMALEFRDVRYKGKLEFLDWGNDKTGAQAIEIRYLSQSTSLDVDYQDFVQNIKLDYEGKDGHTTLEFRSGRNEFDFKKDALLIQMLQVHSQNMNSKSKNPNPAIKGYVFKEVSEDMSDSSLIKHFESELDAGNFVKGISENPQSLRNLFEILLGYGVGFGEITLLSNDIDIYKSLVAYTKAASIDFNSNIERYKKELNDLFLKAEAFKAFDLTKTGTIAILVDNKSEILYEKAEGKERAMLNWVLENFLVPDVFEKSKRLKLICDTKLK